MELKITIKIVIRPLLHSKRALYVWTNNQSAGSLIVFPEKLIPDLFVHHWNVWMMLMMMMMILAAQIFSFL